jgi:hypothetical protein
MSYKFMQWLELFEQLRGARDKGEADGRSHVVELESARDGIAAEGIDYYEITRCFIATVQAELLISERRYQDATAALRGASPRLPLASKWQSLIEANTVIHHGNIALLRNEPESAIPYYEQCATAARAAGSLSLIGNAEFNLATCLALARRDKEALDAYERALEVYQQAGLTQKVADALHQIGNMCRFLGDANSAINYHRHALQLYSGAKNIMGLWRTADDLSRAFLDKFRGTGKSEKREGLLEEAINQSIAASFFSEQVWQKAQAEGQLADLSEQLLGHTITQCELALGKGDLLMFFGALARNKGRIRGRNLPSIEKVLPAIDQDLKNQVKLAIPQAIAHVSLEAALSLVEPGKRVAVLDQLAIQRRSLLTGICILGPDNTKTLDWIESVLPRGDTPPQSARSLRSTNRAEEALELVQKLKVMLEQHANRCCYLLGSLNGPNTSDDYNQLQEWAHELSPALGVLGSWFFPRELRELLRRHEVDHVILIPDPLFLTLPYLALETEHGAIVDEPWSLSIVTSASELMRIVVRRRELKGGRPLFWIGPDSGVNSGSGGDQELVMLEEKFLVDPYRENEATLENVTDLLAAGSWVHFRGHGRWTGDVRTSGPALAFGQTLSRKSLESIVGVPGFMVTAACLTGFSESVGTEAFGSLVDYDRANCYGAVLSSWPIHGPFSTFFMEQFYGSLHAGSNAALSLKNASRRARAAGPHPYLWAPFFIIGGWQVAPMLTSASKQASSM